MEKDRVYCRKLEDGSGFVVCFGSKLPAGPPVGGRNKWEEVLGSGKTAKEAWADYRSRKVVR